jgi:hypothetical protein
MGVDVNRLASKICGWVIVAAIVALNAVLIVSVLTKLWSGDLPVHPDSAGRLPNSSFPGDPPFDLGIVHIRRQWGS